MKQFFKSVVFIFLACVLLTSTAGIGIYLHSCNCEGSYYSLHALQEDCCYHENLPDACCKATTSSNACCSKDANTCEMAPDGTKNCCSILLVYVKLDTDLTLQINQEPIPLPVAEALEIPADPTDLAVRTILASISHEPALTPLSGKSLLTFLHQLRLEAPIA